MTLNNDQSPNKKIILQCKRNRNHEEKTLQEKMEQTSVIIRGPAVPKRKKPVLETQPAGSTGKVEYAPRYWKPRTKTDSLKDRNKGCQALQAKKVTGTHSPLKWLQPRHVEWLCN